MKQNYTVAAADIGGTGGKIAAAAFDGQTIALQEEHTFRNREVMAGGALYWDVLALYADIQEGLAYLKIKHSIKSLGIDTWGVDFGLLDKNGKLMGNLYHMRDFRTKGIPEEIFQKIPMEELFHSTASDCSRFYGLYQLYETQKNSPYLLENARHLMFTPDLLNYFFTGEVGWSDITMAGTSQLLNSSMTGWNFDLFDKLNLPAHYLNPLGYPGELTGQTADGTRVIRVAGHDSATAVACLQDGVFYISGGTYLVTGFQSDTTLLNDAMIAHRFKNTTGPNRKFLCYKNVTGFWTLKEVMEELAAGGEVYNYSDMVTMAAQQPPFQSVVDIDCFAEKKPSMLAAIRNFCQQTGQAIPDTAGKLARCLYESYAMQVRDCFLAAEEISGQKRDAVYVVNGACKNALLCQMFADATGVPVYAGMPRATMLGNIGIQLIANGEIANMRQLREIAERSAPYTVYQPQNTARWAEEYARLHHTIIDSNK